MKRNRISLILLSLLVLTSIVGIFSMNGFAQSTDLNFTFQNDNIYNSINPVYDDSFNIRNQSIYTGYYNATYSFTNEAESIYTTSPDAIAGIDFCHAGTQIVNGESISIINSTEGHDKTMMLIGNTNGADYVIVQNDFSSSQTTGAIEFWIRLGQTDEGLRLTIREGGDSKIHLHWDQTGDLQYNDGVYHDIQTYSADTWYHLRLGFDAADDWHLWINGISTDAGVGYGYQGGNPTNLDNIYILNYRFTDDDTISWFDAIGYSWDVNYSIGDNLNPSYYKTGFQEVDKWEFSYSDFPTQYAVGSDVFSDWTETDIGDHINIARDYISLDGMPTYYPNRKIKIHDWIGSSGNIGIERDFNIIEGILNVSWSLNFTALDALSQSEITTEIYSYDDTLISQIYLEFGDLCYKDGGGSEVILEIGIITTGEIYDFNFYNDGSLILLRFAIDGVHYDTYTIPHLSPNKKGLGKIIVQNYYDPPRELIVYLGNVGVYSNGTSLSTEVAFRQISLDDQLFHKDWFFEPHPLLTLNLNGSIAIHLTDWYFYLELTSIEEIIPLTQFEGVDKIFNMYDKTYDGDEFIFTPKLWLEFYSTLEADSISIDGVQLNQDGKEYKMEFTHGNVDVDESYFYVDSSNRLRGQCFYNDSNLEYIQANFNIDNVLSENRSLRFRGQTSGQYGFFSLSYIDATSSTFDLPVYDRAFNVILPQEKTIEEFVFLITDDDELESGYGSGYIYDIELTWNPSISITIVTIALIMVIIPLIIMIVPTLTLYSRYGKSVIMPVFIFMAIICFAGGLIPAWLFFILMIGAGGFLVLKKGSDT